MVEKDIGKALIKRMEKLNSQGTKEFISRHLFNKNILF